MRKKKIIVIEDDPKTQRLIGAILNAEQYDLLLASDGEEGLEKVRLHVPDLVIMDILLPHKDGYVILETMKRERDLRPVPVILLSAIYVSDLDRRRGLELGADHFLLKPDAFISRPFRANSLLEAVRISLGEKRPAESPPQPRRDKLILCSRFDRDGRRLRRRLDAADLELLAIERISELHQQIHLEAPAAAILDLDGVAEPMAVVDSLIRDEPQVALIIVASPDQGLDPVAVLRAGARDLHWKPLDHDLFLQRLAEVIQSHRLGVARKQLTEQLKRTTTDLLDRIARLETSRRRLQEQNNELGQSPRPVVEQDPIDLDRLASLIRRARRLVTESNDCGVLLLDRLSGAERPLGQLLLENVARMEQELDAMGALINRDVDPFVGRGIP
jgi:DNA-binding response OmpR family regulator